MNHDSLYDKSGRSTESILVRVNKLNYYVNIPLPSGYVCQNWIDYNAPFSMLKDIFGLCNKVPE